MDFMKLFLLSLLLLSLLHCSSSAASHNFLNLTCPNPGNYSNDYLFSRNLNQLTLHLAAASPATKFALASVGRFPTKVNGAALCRGDLNSDDCSGCLQSADLKLRNDCQYKRDAIIWFDDCMLRYTDTEFFGTIDHTGEFMMENPDSAGSIAGFGDAVTKLMRGLAEVAYVEQGTLYASGVAVTSDGETVYGVVQCTQDLSEGDCKKCLDDGIDKLPFGMKGGRIVGPSCNVRFEMYPIVSSS